jgi:hypothetical protein
MFSTNLPDEMTRSRSLRLLYQNILLGRTDAQGLTRPLKRGMQ